MGTFTARLYEKDAPATVENFVALAQGTKATRNPRTGAPAKVRLYDGITFHRVVPGEMVEVVNRSFDSSLQLVQQLREDRSFNLVYHEGARFDIYSSNIDHERFIVLVFDRRQGPNRIGIVWLYTKSAVQDLYNLLAREAAWKSPGA